MAPKARNTKSLYPESTRYAEVLAQEKRVDAHLKALKAKEYRARKKCSGPVKLSESFKWILLLCYVLSSCTLLCAQSYWVYRRKLKKLPPLSEPEMATIIEDMFLATSLESIWAVAESTTRKHSFVRKVAYRWHAKWTLRSWLKKKNMGKGMAVPSGFLVRQYNRIADDIPFEIRPKAVGDPTDNSYSRVFLHRWRFAMRTKWGRIHVQEFISLEEKHAKATLGVCCIIFFKPAESFFLIIWNLFLFKIGPQSVGHFLDFFFGRPHIFVDKGSKTVSSF